MLELKEEYWQRTKPPFAATEYLSIKVHPFLTFNYGGVAGLNKWPNVGRGFNPLEMKVISFYGGNQSLQVSGAFQQTKQRLETELEGWK